MIEILNNLDAIIAFCNDYRKFKPFSIIELVNVTVKRNKRLRKKK